jgi:hypothetical protein
MNNKLIPQVAGNKLMNLIGRFMSYSNDSDDAPFRIIDTRDSKEIAMDYVENALADIRPVWSVL